MMINSGFVARQGEAGTAGIILIAGVSSLVFVVDFFVFRKWRRSRAAASRVPLDGITGVTGNFFYTRKATPAQIIVEFRHQWLLLPVLAGGAFVLFVWHPTHIY